MKKRWNNLCSSVSEEWTFLKNIKVEKYTFLISLIFILSILDAAFTLAWIESGLAIEANPLLKVLLDHGNFAFLGTKILLTGLGCIFLLHTKDESRLSKASIVLLFLTYALLTVYHCLGALQSIDHSIMPDFVDDILLWLS